MVEASGAPQADDDGVLGEPARALRENIPAGVVVARAEVAARGKDLGARGHARERKVDVVDLVEHDADRDARLVDARRSDVEHLRAALELRSQRAAGKAQSRLSELGDLGAEVDTD